MKEFEKKFGKEFLASLPTDPGVYFFLGKDGEVVYVGRARNLRRRLSQYRNAKRLKKHQKMRLIVRDAWQLQTRPLRTHWEAAVQELEAIQTLRPKWNTVGRFTFLYPFLGTRETAGVFSICLSTQIDRHPDYQWFGVFRSRKFVGDAFFAWAALLGKIGHPSAKVRRLDKTDFSYQRSFRQLPAEITSSVPAFLRGEASGHLETLVLQLLDRPGARAQAEQVQGHLRLLKRFYHRECRPLHRALEAVGETTYPVSQAYRDTLFLKFRLIEGRSL